MALAFACASLGAQPSDGDLIVSQGGALGGGFTAAVKMDGRFTTVGPLVPGRFHNWVRMAEDNTDLVISLVDSSGAFVLGEMARVDPAGKLTTLRMLHTTFVQGFDLDGDGMWILYGPTGTFGLDANNGYALTTFFQGYPSPPGNDGLIDRDPGGAQYVVGLFVQNISFSIPKLMTGDRRGNLTTLFSSKGDPLLRFSCAELWAETGYYFTCDSNAPECHLVRKDGSLATSISVPGANAARVNLDGTAWVAAGNLLTRVDLRSGAVVSLVTVRSSAPFAATGVEVYGSRKLTCTGSGQPGTAVGVRLSSRNPADANRAYVLACSLSRRPALRFGIGDRLTLAPDPLFVLSASGRAPTIFRNFSGTTDAFGNAAATVNIPAAMPSALNLAVFCGGVILDRRGAVQTVTNVHWFVLN